MRRSEAKPSRAAVEAPDAKRVEYFFSFRSPYSYLSGPRAFALTDRHPIELEFRGVIPMAMRGQAVPRAKSLHTLRDVKREATRLGMAFGPVHDPIGEGALRCLAVSEHAKEVGRVREFVLAASRGIWAEAVDVATDAGLRRVCDEAGLDWDESRAAVRAPALAERVEANTTRLVELGHWGVPVFDLDGELFWGQDRIEDLERALGTTTRIESRR